MFNKKIILYLTLVALLIFGFSSYASAQTEIKVWHSMGKDYGQEIIEDLTEEFNEENDDIDVELTYSGGYQETLQGAQSALSAGDPPNISMFEQTRGAAFVDAGALEPLNSYFEDTEGLSFDDFFPEVRETAIYDDTIYGIPYNTSTPVMYYNKDLFEEAGLDPEDPPETYEEVKEYSEEIVENTDAKYGIDFYHWGWLFEAYAGSNGAQFLNEDRSEFIFNSEEAVEAMEFTQDLVHEHELARFGSGGEGYDLFFGGDLAMVERSTAALESNKESADFDMGVAPMPYFEEPYVPIGGSNFFMFDTGSQEEKDASWKYLTYIIDKENFANFAKETGYMAAHEDAYESDILEQRFEDEPRARVTYDQLENAHPRPKVPFWGEMASELEWLSDKMFADEADVQETLDDVVETGNKLLRTYQMGGGN